jgi:hypothetical protein
MAQVVERLSNKCEARSSNPSTTEKKKEKFGNHSKHTVFRCAKPIVGISLNPHGTFIRSLRSIS